jgi:hypothetical protein
VRGKIHLWIRLRHSQSQHRILKKCHFLDGEPELTREFTNPAFPCDPAVTAFVL